MRLTKKFPYDEYDYCYAESNENQNNDCLAMNKLGQLEDIEDEYGINDCSDLRKRLDLADKYGELSDELGVDVITLFKARKGFYAYDFHEDYDGIIHFTEDLWANIFEGVLGGSKIVKRKDNVVCVAHAYCDFQDYGKTWALTKEELEK